MTKKQRYFETRIRELTLSGVRQSDIARILCVSRITVRELQRELGLPTRQQPKVDAADVITFCLHHLDSVFPKLPVGPEHDAIAASAMVSALKQRTPGYFAQASKSNAEELEGLIRSAIFIKRACSDQGMVH